MAVIVNLGEYSATGGDWGATINTIADNLTSVGGGLILVPPGTYDFLTPIRMRGRIHLQGVESVRWLSSVPSTTVFRVVSGFSGSALIKFTDRASTGLSEDPSSCGVRHLTLSGNGGVGTGINGIELSGTAPDNEFAHLNIREFSGAGLKTSTYSGRKVQDLHAQWVYCYGNESHGFDLAATIDSQFVSCEAAANYLNGWDVSSGASNTEFVHCSAEWNLQHGFYLYGTNDGPTITAFTSDRNNWHGMFIGAAPSNQPLMIFGMKNRRDGRNNGSGGGGYAGFAVIGDNGTDTAPNVWVTGLVQEVGRDDDGGGTYSPQYGISTQYASSLHIEGKPWGSTAAINDGFTNFVDYGFGTQKTSGNPGSQVTTYSHHVVSDGTLRFDATDASFRSSGDVEQIQVSHFGYVEMLERSDPTAPASNKARLYVRDNGAGKTQLCVRFPTGAVQVIATEP